MTDRSRHAGSGHRLFFALWPTDEVRAALAQAVDASALLRDAGRRVAPAKYHITLHFLGGWPTPPDAVLERARAAAATLRCAPFHLVVERAGGFHGAAWHLIEAVAKDVNDDRALLLICREGPTASMAP